LTDFPVCGIPNLYEAGSAEFSGKFPKIAACGTVLALSLSLSLSLSLIILTANYFLAFLSIFAVILIISLNIHHMGNRRRILFVSEFSRKRITVDSITKKGIENGKEEPGGFQRTKEIGGKARICDKRKGKGRGRSGGRGDAVRPRRMR
jgi:hypothetical protein